MSEGFDTLVDQAVKNWRERAAGMNAALRGMADNPKDGRAAEKYIIDKIKKLPAGKYIAYQSKGSRSPADVFALGRRKGFWHIMLVQVKSSTDKNKIAQNFLLYHKELKMLADDVRKLAQKHGHGHEPLVISYGYAGVYTSPKGYRFLDKTAYFNALRSNTGELDWSGSAKNLVENAHSLR